MPSTEPHHSYRLLLILMQSYPAAASELREAARLAPKNAQIQSDLGDVLAVQGSVDDAAAAYRLATQLKPDFADAHASLGSVLASQGKIAGAEDEFFQAIRFNPELYQAHLDFGILLIHDGKLAKGKANCEKAPESPDPDVRNVAHAALAAISR